MQSPATLTHVATLCKPVQIGHLPQSEPRLKMPRQGRPGLAKRAPFSDLIPYGEQDADQSKQNVQTGDII